MSDNEVVGAGQAPSVDRAQWADHPLRSQVTSDGGPETIRFLDASGRRVDNELTEPYASYVTALDGERLRAFYRDMVLIRRVDAEGTALQRQGELGLWPSLLGQEAAQVGIGRAMSPHDYAFPGYREHGVAWCRDVDPTYILGMWRGVHNGGWDPEEKNFGLYTIVIGNQVLHAVGYAMGLQRDGAVGTGDPDRDTAVVTFFGDGATAQGDVNEGFVFAGVNHSPVVFFCQNNQWAISEPNHRQTRTPIYQRAAGFGFPGLRVDGNDILASYAVSKHALDQARTGQGPTLIEAFTYRMGAHTTSDDPTKYRDAAEVDIWRERDPIRRLRSYLDSLDEGDDAYYRAVDEEADEMASRIRAATQQMVDPPHEQLFDHCYVDDHPGLQAERDEFFAYQAGFEEDHR